MKIIADRMAAQTIQKKKKEKEEARTAEGLVRGYNLVAQGLRRWFKFGGLGLGLRLRL